MVKKYAICIFLLFLISGNLYLVSYDLNLDLKKYIIINKPKEEKLIYYPRILSCPKVESYKRGNPKIKEVEFIEIEIPKININTNQNIIINMPPPGPPPE